MTNRSVTEAELRSLANAAGQAGDIRQALLVEVALGAEINRDAYTGVVDHEDWLWLDGFDQDSALAACVEAINDAAGRR